MRKSLTFFISILIGTSLSGQSGSGIPGDPYYGTISGTPTWNPDDYTDGEVYVGSATLGEDLTINGGHLTILPGIKVIFMTNGSDLIITSSGQLTSDGTPTSKITFTRYYPTFTSWGHISFETSAGTSLMDNCIIEYGDVSSFDIGDPKGAGGGLFIGINGVTVSYCIFQHNKAQWGGGIVVYSGSISPSISNCYFYDNYAKEAGGGIYLWNEAGSVVENCIFQENHCDGTSQSSYTGGGLASQTHGSVKLLNCTFVNNTSSRISGQSIMFYNSTSGLVLNCLVWGNTGNHFYLSGTNTIQHNAVQGSAPTGTGNFVLNSLNTGLNPMGPFFTDPDESDWSIQVVSPCRDAGKTPDPTVPKDYIGNSRIGAYDIGAYEVQYNGWKTTASTSEWGYADNWGQGIPTSNQNIVISTGASNYPNVSTEQDYNISSGYGMVLEPGAQVTLDQLTNSGDLKLKSDASNISSLIINSYSGNDADVELYLTGGPVPDGYRWHLISSPFMTLDKSEIWSTTNNLAQWIENYDRGTLSEGYVAADGWDYADQEFTGPTFSNLDLGKGYTHYYASNHTYTIRGELNTEDKSVDITCSNTELPLLYGHNLLGNPFSSGLDWDAIVNDASYPNSTTSKALHYRKDAQHVYYVNGVGSDEGVNGIIPPMQGFFVKTFGESESIKLPAGARTHNDIPSRYKGKGSATIPLVRLKIMTADLYDNAVVRFDENAKSGLDYDFDAMKDFISDTRSNIYTVSEGTKFVINGLPYPEPDDTTEISVVVNIISPGMQRILVSQLQGLDNYDVTLTDNISGIEINLKTMPEVTFTASSGLLTDRFILKISNATTGFENPAVAQDVFSIYHHYEYINILPLADEWNGTNGSVKVLDLSGRTITNMQNTEFNKNSIIQVQAPDTKGLYLVEIRSGVKRHVGKVVIK